MASIRLATFSFDGREETEVLGSGGPALVLKSSGDDALGTGSPALTLKSSSKLDLSTMAQA